LRRFVLASVCTFVLFTTFAHAQDIQRIDAIVGGSSLFASKFLSASQAYQPPAENGGIYPTFGVEAILENRLGVSAEGAIRFNRGTYNGYQPYRPMFFDVNGVFAPQVNKRISLDLMAGVGIETVLFYNEFGSCSSSNSFCRTNLNSSHFLIHLGGGPRYYFHGHFFVRPEAHYYFIRNNFEFHSDNLLRLGASIGYTWGSK
jgi:hypothetical protein